MIKLSILICTIPQRAQFFDRLWKILEPQETEETEIIYNDHRFHSIGRKRNDLLEQSRGQYICFIDDDDRVSDNYVKLLMEGINKGVDCCSLKGIITEDGQNPLVFEHSIKYNAYKTNENGHEVRYERYPNHLNAIRSDIAKRFRFQEISHGEDTEWATQIHKSGLLKTEHYIPEVIYHYEYRSKK
jgi:glycosyltransferase involved in cell wall biosynthesis